MPTSVPPLSTPTTTAPPLAPDSTRPPASAVSTGVLWEPTPTLHYFEFPLGRGGTNGTREFTQATWHMHMTLLSKKMVREPSKQPWVGKPSLQGLLWQGPPLPPSQLQAAPRWPARKPGWQGFLGGAESRETPPRAAPFKGRGGESRLVSCGGGGRRATGSAQARSCMVHTHV